MLQYQAGLKGRLIGHYVRNNPLGGIIIIIIIFQLQNALIVLFH